MNPPAHAGPNALLSLQPGDPAYAALAGLAAAEARQALGKELEFKPETVDTSGHWAFVRGACATPVAPGCPWRVRRSPAWPTPAPCRTWPQCCSGKRRTPTASMHGCPLTGPSCPPTWHGWTGRGATARRRPCSGSAESERAAARQRGGVRM